MNEQEQQIAIAEASKWKRGFVEENSFSSPGKLIRLDRWIDPNGIPHRRLPDYLHDLNAMREALTSLTAAQQDVYACFLGSITGGRSIDFGAKCVNATTAILFASAAQQAEAFLRAIGKWKKTP